MNVAQIKTLVKRILAGDEIEDTGTSKALIARVWRDYEGSPLAAAMSVSDDEAVVENIVDFDEEGGDFVLGVDSGTYTGIDEDTNTVLGLDPVVTVAHPKATFLYAGTKPRGPKRADGYVDGSDSLTQGILIPAHLRRFFPIGKRKALEMEDVSIDFDENGKAFVSDTSLGEETGEIQWFKWSMTGEIEVGVRPHRDKAPFTGVIEVAFVTMGDGGAPTGSSAIFEVLKGGSTAVTLTVPATELSSDRELPNEPITFGNILQIEVTQVGSTLPGSDPTITLGIRPKE